MRAALFAVVALASTAWGQGFESRFEEVPDRVWIGQEYWANRLQDWRVAAGRLECTASKPRLRLRTLHLLTHRLGTHAGGFETRVRTGLVDPREPVTPDSVTGFLVGAGGDAMDPRAAALVHQWPGAGGGLLAVCAPDGRLSIRDNSTREDLATSTSAGFALGVGIELTLVARPGDDGFALELSAHSVDSGVVLARVSAKVPATRLVGNVALVSDPGSKSETAAPGRYWFDAWRLSGTRVDHHPNRTFGPIVATQYTLSRGVMKLTAQMTPVASVDPRDVRLQVRESGDWRTIARAEIVEPGFTATFRVEGWDATRDTPYRLRYDMRMMPDAIWSGTVRADPVAKETIVVAGFTGNHNNSHNLVGGWGARGKQRSSWIDGMWFPHADITGSVARHDPDLLFFSGDQIYEGASPSFADRENIELDYLYKWYLWCWAYRDLTRDRPTITIPDDHDVYQGNIWGEGGRKTKRDHFGGYVHPAEFVKMVERTQTSHLPDPYDPTPIEQGIGVYYTSLTYGRIGFAVIEDRKFKSGPAGGRLPATGTNRPDHINDPDFDISRADVPGVTLLGDRQLAFLDDWAADWRGHDMKLALSQTVFANMATHHGAGLTRLIADLDSNGWPQTGRRKALEALRRGFAAHLCGDQHLATLVHHGVDDHGDASWSFCVPSIANFYPRGWWPLTDGENRPPSSPPWMGDHHDGFGNPVTVYAASNPRGPTGHEPADLHDRMPGYGIVRLNKRERTITFECWPRHADPSSGEQYPGWPRTIAQTDNYLRAPAGHLPEIAMRDASDPVVQVIDESTNEIVYTLRIRGDRFRPPVFDAESTYTLRVGDPDKELWRELSGVVAGTGEAAEPIEIDL